jgi:two-component system KDP operon response regulator KdpE
MNAAEILIIDDEAQIRKLLDITLQANDFKVKLADNAKNGLMEARNCNPDLILLDLGLPDESGQAVLKKLREWFTKPILILSVQSGEEEIVKALDNGANDYLVKPFRTGELLARIRSSLRGFAPHIAVSSNPNSELEIDTVGRQVKRKGETIRLTSTEYDLLALFYKNEGRVLTHQHLLKEVWGPGYLNQSQYLRVFIAQLRKKIEPDPDSPKFIITESGVGYRLVLQDSQNEK